MHEVANGMMHRADKKRIPLGFIPNGSGNDLCLSLAIYDFDRALDYIVKGDIFNMDLIRCLIDHEEES